MLCAYILYTRDFYFYNLYAYSLCAYDLYAYNLCYYNFSTNGLYVCNLWLYSRLLMKI